MRPARLLPLLALLASCATARSGADAAGDEAAAPSAESARADHDLLWEEAVFTFDGGAYTYRVLVFATEAEARACHDRFATPACRKASATWREADTRLNEIPLRLRERVVALAPSGLSEPFPAIAGSGWMLVDLEKQKPTKFVGAVDPQAWLAKFAPTALPRVEDLRTDPVLVARRARNRVRTSADLAAALESGAITRGQLDDRLSSGNTLLLKALYLGDHALMESLLASGARPDACGLSMCPLTTAVLLRDTDAVRLLLAHEADPNGVPSEQITPLMAASVNADRDLAQRLLDGGADPLVSRPERVAGLSLLRSTLFHAHDEPRAYLDWLDGVVDAALARTGKYGWSAWVEQGGKRFPLADGATVTLRRAPFRVVTRMGAGAGLRVVASEDPALLERSRDVALRRDLLSAARVGASGPDGKFLGVAPLAFEGARLHWSVATNEWGYVEDAARSTGTTRRVAKDGRPELVHEVEELIITDRPAPGGRAAKDASRTVRLAGYDGPGLAVLMGVMPPLGTASDLFQPLRFTLRFRP